MYTSESARVRAKNNGVIPQLAWFANVTATQPLTLVLWGQGFNEIAASIFVAELRHLGKRVKLVGLNHKSITGQHGVILVPDLSLGQALRSVNGLQCLIVPAPLTALQQFSYDPRMAELLEIITQNQVLVVADEQGAESEAVPDHATHEQSSTHHLPAPFTPPQLLVYPAPEELLSFVHTTLSPRLA